MDSGSWSFERSGTVNEAPVVKAPSKQSMVVTKFFGTERDVEVEVFTESFSELGLWFKHPIEILGIQTQKVEVDSDART